MDNILKKILFLTLIIIAAAMPVLAQRTGSISGGSSGSTTPSKPILTVQCNIRNAQVQISTQFYKDGPIASGTAPFSTQLDAGTYVVTVTASGYEQQQQTIQLNGNQTVNFNLGQEKANLTVQCNVRDAKVVITGGGISGQLIGSAPFTAQLGKGSYSINVTAPGFLSASRQVSLDSNQTLNISLDAESYSLTVTCNVPGAKVFIKGGDINGQLTGTSNMTTVLPQGTYRIKVNAPGYAAEDQTVVFTQSTTVNFQLQPRTGRLDIIIPNNMLDYSQPNPANKITIYDNGIKVNGTSLQLDPGQHTIRITSGGLASQQTINVNAGESYRIELNFGFALIRE